MANTKRTRTNKSVDGTLAVSGASTLAAVTASGTATLNGALNVNGLSDFNDDVNIDADLTVDNLVVSGTTDLGTPNLSRYSSANGQGVARGVWTKVIYEIADESVITGYSLVTGVFTASETLKLLVTASAEVEGVAGGSLAQLRIFKNGAIYDIGTPGGGGTADGTQFRRGTISTIVPLVNTDTFQIEFFFDDSTADRNLRSSAIYNKLSILKVK